jgi:uncharacterized integral membrane protein (TIGR00698 family)
MLLPRRSVVPGLAFVALVTLVSLGIAAVETRVLGHPVIEALVVSLVLGMLVRTAWTPPSFLDAGIRFSAKEVLEVAILLLGVAVDLPLLMRAGPSLAIGIVLLVVIGLVASYGIGRALGLRHELAVLVACGNSICGNSAIAAVAPVIDADKEHVASSIAFTAILGVAVVLGLPLLQRPLGLSFYQYGVLAGLTVYAVPQVLAAAFPVSVLSGQVGTLVKLVRVLMLGPVVLFFALTGRRAQHARAARDANASGGGDAVASRPRFQIGRYVPWFIPGFLLLAALRSSGAIPAPLVDPARTASSVLTVAAMAGLGLGVNLRALRGVGRPVVVTVCGSLAVLMALAVTLIHLLAIQ